MGLVFVSTVGPKILYLVGMGWVFVFRVTGWLTKLRGREGTRSGRVVVDVSAGEVRSPHV